MGYISMISWALTILIIHYTGPIHGYIIMLMTFGSLVLTQIWIDTRKLPIEIGDE